MKAKKIMCIIGYDISDNRKRYRVEKLLSGCGVRVNLSLFECVLSYGRYVELTKKLPSMIDTKCDRVVIYRICVDCYSTSLAIPDKTDLYESVKIY